MNDWLDVMLEEIARKKREAREAERAESRHARAVDLLRDLRHHQLRDHGRAARSALGAVRRQAGYDPRMVPAVAAAAKVPSPAPRSTLTLSWFAFADIRSSPPTPSRSPIATAHGALGRLTAEQGEDRPDAAVSHQVRVADPFEAGDAGALAAEVEPAAVGRRLECKHGTVELRRPPIDPIA